MTSPPIARSTPDHVRQRFGNRYTIERELGRGGMGVVYLARDLQLDRLVALKVLPQEFAVQPVLRDRFLRETRTAAGFSHPNIVPVYAVEEADDLLAYAMGYVDGESLVERVRRAGPLATRDLVRLMQDVGYALAYAHGHGVVHRDIKPDNIMIERASGRALVMDFGIARTLAAKAAANAGLTRVGEVVGTPEYMSPEQASGDDVDGRSDLYSLGLTLFFAALGHTAVSAESTQKVLVKQLTEALPPLSSLRADLPERLGNVIDMTLQKDPRDRFESAAAMVDALDVTQLATPEIPVPLRLFAQEAATLSMIATGILATVAVVYHGDGGDDDAMLLSLLLLVVLVTRVMQTFTEAERLAVAGFTPDDIRRGLQSVVDEREGRRSELRNDLPFARARRRTVVIASGLLVGAAVAFRGALVFRHQTGPASYSTSPPGVVLLLGAIGMLGTGLVLLLRSPLRMPLGERLFRHVWIGAPGRWFVSLAGRRMRQGDARAARKTPAPRNTSAPRSTPPRTTPPPEPALVSGATPVGYDRFNELEARVRTLEHKVNSIG